MPGLININGEDMLTFHCPECKALMVLYNDEMRTLKDIAKEGGRD